MVSILFLGSSVYTAGKVNSMDLIVPYLFLYEYMYLTFLNKYITYIRKIMLLFVCYLLSELEKFES